LRVAAPDQLQPATFARSANRAQAFSLNSNSKDLRMQSRTADKLRQIFPDSTCVAVIREK
jgi:hypothetical protein